MKREERGAMSPKWVWIIIGVLLALVVLVSALFARGGKGAERREDAPERSLSEESSLSEQSAPEPEASGTAEEEKRAEEADVYAPVSGGVPASPLAQEGDPYPGLYAQWQEKTDDNTKKIVYLTFDDGPSENTERILEILKQYDVKAAFFVSSQYGTEEERARRLRMILEQGHTLGLHTATHDYEKIYQSMDSFLADLNAINEEVYAATGFQASLTRFPGGSSNQHNQSICEELAAEVRRRGYTYHDWAVSCGDAEGKNLSGEQVMRETADECEKRDKSVVLFHDSPSQDTTVEALPSLIEELREKGYEFARLDESIRPFQFVKTE